MPIAPEPMTRSDFGLSVKDVKVDLKKVVKYSRGVASQLSNGVGYLMKKNKIPVFDGHGRLDGPGKLAVTKDGKAVATLSAKHIVLASGARARSLPGLEPDGMNGSDALRLYVFANEAEGQAVVVALIDNLGKGAAGQAVQNMNLMLGLPETAGLKAGS